MTAGKEKKPENKISLGKTFFIIFHDAGMVLQIEPNNSLLGQTLLKRQMLPSWTVILEGKLTKGSEINPSTLKLSF